MSSAFQNRMISSSCTAPVPNSEWILPMSLVDLKYVLFISEDETVIEILKHVVKRLGAHKTKYCTRQSQALSELENHPFPELIIEDLKIIDEPNFFPVVQEKRMKNYLIPIPVFALISPTTKDDIEVIQNSDYIGYELAPLNESLLEQKIRDLYYESYSYDQANALNEIVEQHITNKNFKSAYRDLLPALGLKPKNVSYLLLYATILFEQSRYAQAEKVINFILKQDPDNLKAKNILTKILITLERYNEGEAIK